LKKPEPGNERNVKKAPSLTLTQQLQIVISNTMAGRLSSRVWYCVNGQERALNSLEVEAEP